jgi:hypothetical protein
MLRRQVVCPGCQGVVNNANCARCHGLGYLIIEEKEVPRMAVTSREAKDQGAEPKKKTRGPSTTMIRGSTMERALIIALRVAAWLLIALSVIGTFYGVRNQDAPITQPWLLFRDIPAAWNVALLALAGQVLLALLQWGSRRMARHDPRWWLGYVAGLAPSIWWNWQAYGDPLMSLGVPLLVALGIIIGGDMFPELTLVRDDE